MNRKKIKPIVGERIKMARINKGMTRNEVAEKIWYSPQTIYSWESGKHTPKYSTLEDLAKLFGCSLDWLIGMVDVDMRICEEDLKKIPINEFVLDVTDHFVNVDGIQVETAIVLAKFIYHDKDFLNKYLNKKVKS